MPRTVRRLTTTVVATTLLAAGAGAGLHPAVAAEGDKEASRAIAEANVEIQSGTNVVARISGDDRFLTAVEISANLFRDDGDATDELRAQAGAVVLTRSDDFADGLAGVPLAAVENAPMLLTETAALGAATEAEIDRVLPAGGTVYVLGEFGAVSQDVEEGLVADGFTVVRLGGTDRFATAVSIAVAVNDDGDAATTDSPQAIFVTTGMNFADALSAGPATTLFGEVNAAGVHLRAGVIVLTDGNTLPTPTQDYLDEFAPTADIVYGVGGPAAAATEDVVGQVALFGDDRYATATAVAELFLTNGFAGTEATALTSVSVASGQNFPDALSGGAASAMFAEPMLLTQARALPDATSMFMQDLSFEIDVATIYGGPGPVSNPVAGQILGAIDD